ncbi:MAG: DUF362 domain-containing protein [Synergistaceae bacterium]|nr:DUF362 domain-containing protein [Synergistaceae bacterium]
MASKVWFASFRTQNAEGNKINRLRRVMDAMNMTGVLRDGDLTAVKVHFGERGNDTYLSPVFVRQVVDRVKAAGAKPFVTDSNTLYRGSRKNSVDHLETALEHGYSYATVGAPIIIADGLRSGNYVDVQVDGKYFRKVKIAADIAAADSMVVLSHFKGHGMAGFGGAIKNLAMGCAPSKGKEDQHAYIHPHVNADCCQGCGRCVAQCPEYAIRLDAKRKATVNTQMCIGCGECAATCASNCIDMKGGDASDLSEFIARMTEYAYGAVLQKKDRVAFISFVMNVTPDCDCCGWSDSALVPDVGIMASFDPVALDKACLDRVNAQSGNPDSQLSEDAIARGADKFKGVYPNVHGEIQIDYGAALGMGTQSYETVEV